MIHTTQECRIGDAHKLTKELPAESIDLVVTSPPYWGLRDYGVDGQIGLEGTLEEYHTRLLDVTAECMRVLKQTGVMFWNHGDNYGGSGGSGGDYNEGGLREGQAKVGKNGGLAKCLAMQNERLIIRMIDEQGWILRNRIIWSKPNGMPASVTDRFSNRYEPVYLLVKNNKPAYFYNNKTGVMQRDKPPGTKGEEGVDWDWKDVAKVSGIKRKKVSNWIGRDYWFDLNAVRVPHKESTLQRQQRGMSGRYREKSTVAFPDRNPHNINRPRPNMNRSRTLMEAFDERTSLHPLGKNPGDVWDINSPEDDWKQLLEVASELVGTEAAIAIFESYMESRDIPSDVWTIPTQPYPGSHFATFPPSLIEPMIRAACPAEICPVCGLARERIIEPTGIIEEPNEYNCKIGDVLGLSPTSTLRTKQVVEKHTIGWTSCACNAGWIAGTVLDPFCGSGTVPKMCRLLNLNAIVFDLNPEYEQMIRESSMSDTPPLTAYEPERQAVIA